MNIIRKSLYLLNISQRKQSMVLLLLMIVGMLLETLGIGLVIPALSIIMKPDFLDNYTFFIQFFGIFGKPSHPELIVISVVVLILVYVFKAFFLSYLAWKQSCFIFDLQKWLSQRLFSIYLQQPYTFYMQRNSAHLIRNVIAMVGEFVNVALKIILLCTEFLVIFGVSILLFTANFLNTLFLVLFFSSIGFAYYFFTKKIVLRWGESWQHHEAQRILFLQEGFGSIKEIKLLACEKTFLERYEEHNIGAARVGRNQTALQSMPRLWLEALAILAMGVIIISISSHGNLVEKLVPMLGLYAVAAFRLMPSATRIFTGLQQIRYSMPVIKTLYEELLLAKDPPVKFGAEPFNFSNAICLSEVCFNYPGSIIPVLNKLDLKIFYNTTVAFIGPSGAGKTTLVDIILGLLIPTSGKITVDSVDIQSNLRGWQKQVGYVPQVISLTDDTLRSNVAFGVPTDQIDDEAVNKAIKAAQLIEFVDKQSEGVNILVGEQGIRLSGGQKQRIGIARALYHNPEILVFDEATSSLDTETEKSFVEAVKALKGSKTIIIVAHRLTTIAHCDFVYRLENETLSLDNELLKNIKQDIF